MEQLKQAIMNLLQQYYTYRETPNFFRQKAEIVECLNDSVEDVHAQIPLSPELIYFYSHFKMNGPIRQDGHQLHRISIDIGNGNLYLSEPVHLYHRQLGFRWVGSSAPYEENPMWNASWVVIADKDDDPIIVDTSQRNSPVLASYDAREVFSIADSLAQFFAAIAVVLKVLHERFAGEIMDEETCEIEGEFLNVLTEELMKVLNNQEHVQYLIDYLYG